MFFKPVVLASLVFLAITAGTAQSGDDAVRLNEIQIIGTHNSYHAGLAPSEAKLLAKTDPKEASALDYRHQSLTKQLEGGMRELELDVFPDPDGGRYATSRSFKDVVAAGLPPDPVYYPAGLMDKPGFKVMHKADTDYRSNCQPFSACLSEVRAWSKAHPNHLPLFMFIETKVPTSFTAKDFENLDAEVRAVFTHDELITPDAVRGKRTSLREAVQKEGWPTLAQSRGKLIFLLSREEVAVPYLAGHPALQGRVFFVNGKLGAPDTVFTVQAKNKHNFIQQLVADRMLVYTRCDADMVEAHANDTTRRNGAFESGAQVLSTDYPATEPAVWTGYTVQFPKGEVGRCNPILHPKHCVSADLEPDANSRVAAATPQAK